MMTRRLLLTSVIALFVALLGCDSKKADDATLIRAVVDDLARQAPAHDISGMLGHATSDFRADPGNRDRQAVKPLLLMAVRRYGKFRVAYPVPGIEVDAAAGSATVSVPFLIVREGEELPDEAASLTEDPFAWAEALASEFGDPYQLDMTMKRTPDGWKVRRAEIAGFKSIHDL